MAIKFNVGKTNEPKQEAAQAQEPTQTHQPPPTENGGAHTMPAAHVPGKQTPAPFLKTGDAQKTQMQQVQAHQALRSKLRSGAREFWLKPGEFAKVVFLDGTLIGKGVFDTPTVDVHMIQINGDWHKVICNQATEGRCLLCEGDRQPSTVQLFTVINLMPYVIQNGPKKGQTLNGRLQLMAVPFSIRSKLVRRAENHDDTLVGGVYQFLRSDTRSTRTGDDIEFVKTANMAEVLQAYPMLSGERNAKGEWVPKPTATIDYATAYPMLTNAEIAALRPDLANMAGWGSVQAASFGEPSTSGDVDDELPF